MEITANQIKKVTADWSRIAEEPVRCEMIGGTMYAFGSELATLRLFKAMPQRIGTNGALVFNRQFYSTNKGTYFFAIENFGG